MFLKDQLVSLQLNSNSRFKVLKTKTIIIYMIASKERDYFKILPLDGARLCKPIDLDRRRLCKVTEDGQIVDHERMKERVLILVNEIM